MLIRLDKSIYRFNENNENIFEIKSVFKKFNLRSNCAHTFNHFNSFSSVCETLISDITGCQVTLKLGDSLSNFVGHQNVDVAYINFEYWGNLILTWSELHCLRCLQ